MAVPPSTPQRCDFRVVASSTISHYKILTLTKLGEGRMGVVYKAEEETIGKVQGCG